MTKFKFQWQEFKMDDATKEFLEKYILKIKKYAESHNISDDLVDDINQSILEKLFELEWEITQKKVVQIVNSIGEPEDFFEEVSSEKTATTNDKNEKKSDVKPYEKRQKTNWTRPRDKAILLWVCAMFGQATWINRWFWRIAVLLWTRFFCVTDMLWAFAFWSFVYILLALIFPIKDKDYKHCSMLSYRLLQIWDLRLIVPNFSNRLWSIWKWVVKKAVPWILSFFSKLFWPLWIIVKYLFLIWWSLFLLWIIITLGVFAYYLFTKIVISNLDFSWIFPDITKYGVVLWIISAFILFLASIWAILKKKLSNNLGLILAILCWLLAIIIAIISGIQLRENVINVSWATWDEITKDVNIEVDNRDKKIQLFFRGSDYSDFKNLLIHEQYFVNLFPSDTDDLKVVYNYSFKDKNEKNIIQAEENLSNIEYSWQWDNYLVIWFENNEVFKAITPAIYTNIFIDIYVPKDLSIELQNVWYMVDENVGYPSWTNIVSSHFNRDCSLIKYNKQTENFYCTLDMSIRDKHDIAMYNLQKMADEIIPLKWSNSKWSELKNGIYLDRPYWSLDSINIYDNESLLAKFSDKFFNFFITIQYSIDEDTWEFEVLNSSIKEIEQKWLMNAERMEYYSWWEDISDYDIEIDDKEKESNEIQQINERIDWIEQKLNSILSWMQNNN